MEYPGREAMGRMKDFLFGAAESQNLDPASKEALAAAQKELDQIRARLFREWINQWSITPVRNGVLLRAIKIQGKVEFPAGTTVPVFVARMRDSFPEYSWKYIERSLRRGSE
jgi:hypothetical protein